MGRSLAILGVPGVLDGGGAADTSFSMTVTTTGAQQLKLDGLTVSASTTVDWGDNSSNDYTGSGSRTHNYAGAGTWTVTIKQPLNVTGIDLRDKKITALTGANVTTLPAKAGSFPEHARRNRPRYALAAPSGPG